MRRISLEINLQTPKPMPTEQPRKNNVIIEKKKKKKKKPISIHIM